MKADILREKFLQFFAARKHRVVDSDSLVPKDDPTVLFTPAGMNQFKKQFMGLITDFRRAASSQRCLRTDDLEKVGKTTCHHTFFEMLGNFSFGDYFKEDAIVYAWEFLTNELKIPEEKLWVSVYKDDDEAYNIWKDEIRVPEHKIIRLGDKENFWPSEAKTKGPNGPCGPCSEIFYDLGRETGCGKPGCDPACGCKRFPEIWNLVFTQYNRKEGGVLEPLPKKNIDTGMGLERLAAVMQGAGSNFETELFQPIIKEIEKSIKADIAQDQKNEFIYAVADHIRAVVFCIYDGVLPSNEGRGYIVRKIIRKSIMHLRSLGINKPFLNRLVPLVALAMHNPYPDLKDRQEDIARVILNEERNFGDILDSRDTLFAKIPLNGGVEEIGAAVFKLHDTYGFPSEEIEKWLKEQNIGGLAAISASANRRLEEQRQRSKSQSKMRGDVFDAQGLGLKIEETKFVGYKENSTEAIVLAILKDDRESDEALPGGEELKVVLDQTPFYAESGGQVGDTGRLISGKSAFEVSDTQKINNVFLHIGKVKSGSFKKGDRVTAEINLERRQNIARNHTATHILQAALRKVLGTHVQQQGSLVGEEKFRFDFTHFKGLSNEEISRVEEVANSYISESQAVNCKKMGLKEAKKEGALAFFEEKYGEDVRVVSIGDISKELCGGTHLDNIKKIGLIKIISEGSVASGIRRIEGTTAGFAERFIKEEEEKSIEESKKTEKLKRLKEQEKRRSEEIRNSLQERVQRIINNGVKINGINLISALEADLDMNSLRLLADKVKNGLKQGVVALGSGDSEQKKAYLIITVTQDLLSDGLDAEALISQVAWVIGGSGGGRKDFAQAGGTKPENIQQAFDTLKSILEK